MTVRVAMWSGPRNISTAMMRAWENREDTVVVDEPLYAAFLARTGIDHPGRDVTLASQTADQAEAVDALLAPLPDGVSIHYAKHMAHHLAADDDLGWTADFRNVLLIRDPGEVVASYVRSREACEPDDIGLLQQQRLMQAWRARQIEAPVIDAGRLPARPRGLPPLALRLARHRVHASHAQLAGRAAGNGRGVGPLLVRHRALLDRVRALATPRGRPERARPGRRGGLPARLRAAPGAPGQAVSTALIGSSGRVGGGS